MEVYYISGASGERIELTGPLYWIDVGELLNYRWSYRSSVKKIKSFQRDISEKKVEITVSGKDDIEYAQAVNKLNAAFDKDITELKPGRLFIGENYMECYFYDSQKENAMLESNIMFNSYKILSDGAWIREIEYSFSFADALDTSSKRYRNRYPYRYANGLRDNVIINEHFSDTDFKLTVYGPVLNPQIIIGSHQYLVNTYLEVGEYMVIDSRSRTVKKTMNNGTVVNLFENRDKKKTVFKKIVPGRNSVRWSGKFEFFVTLYEERSEPKWH